MGVHAAEHRLVQRSIPTGGISEGGLCDRPADLRARRQKLLGRRFRGRAVLVQRSMGRRQLLYKISRSSLPIFVFRACCSYPLRLCHGDASARRHVYVERSFHGVRP